MSRKSSTDFGRDQVLAAVEPVEGWLYPEEAWALHQAALEVIRTTDVGPCLVEIGSWKGRSTVAIGLALKAAGRGRLYAIDPHTGSSEHIVALGAVDTFGAFMKNVEAARLAEVVVPVRSTSHVARSELAGLTVDLLFVDGSHEYADVLQDIDDWQPALSMGAKVAFNDVFWDGVSHALGDRVVRRRSPYRQPRLVKNTLIFDYAPGSPWKLVDTITVARLRGLIFIRRRLRRIRRILPQPVVRVGHLVSERLVG